MVKAVVTKETLAAIPHACGCYLFYNKHGDVVYVGKSKRLHDRVRQYFAPGKGEVWKKHTRLAAEIHRIETRLTATETDALLLECLLIKQHKPRYNSQLARTPQYAYIRIGTGDYPPVTVVPAPEADGAEYFGGFYDAYDAKAWVEALAAIWQTPRCLKADFRTAGAACLRFHLAQCPAPCRHEISPTQYRARLQEMARCLRGEYPIHKLESAMQAAAAQTDFEKAAALRDHIQTLTRLQRRQKSFCTELAHVFLFLQAFNAPGYSLFYIEDGYTTARWDAQDLCPPARAQWAAFIQTATKNEKTAEGKALTACLLEIRASKIFVRTNPHIDKEKTLDALFEGFCDFIPAATV